MATSTNNNAREIIFIEPLKAVETQKLKVAGYARVSSDSADQLNSFAAQVIYYTQLIEENQKWELVEVYADEGVTGVSTEKRDDFNRMIKDCRNGKIDRIITKSVSRFARNTLDSISTLRELRSMGVTVCFEKEGIDTATLNSENLVTLYSLFAQQESMSISQNCKKGARMRMAEGTYVASNAPYGYRLVNNQLEIYEPEAEVVRGIFKRYLRGTGSSQIAEALNQSEVNCKNGGTLWWPSAINKILKNERYIGDALFQKTFNEDVIPYNNRINNGELTKYYVNNAHAPIITRIEYELANILIKERVVQHNKAAEAHLFTGKITCNKCGRMYGHKLSKGKSYWVCRQHDQNASACSSQRITEDSIYKAFIRMYNKLKQNQNNILTPLLAQLEKLREQGYKDSVELATINKQIAETSEQNHVMTGLLSKGILDSALFISQSNELKFKLQKLKQRKARLLSEVKEDLLLTKIEELTEIVENGPAFITEMDEELFADIVEKIEAQDSRSIDFILHGGLRLKERL